MSHPSQTDLRAAVLEQLAGTWWQAALYAEKMAGEGASGVEIALSLRRIATHMTLEDTRVPDDLSGLDGNHPQ